MNMLEPYSNFILYKNKLDLSKRKRTLLFRPFYLKKFKQYRIQMSSNKPNSYQFIQNNFKCIKNVQTPFFRITKTTNNKRFKILIKLRLIY